MTSKYQPMDNSTFIETVTQLMTAVSGCEEPVYLTLKDFSALAYMYQSTKTDGNGVFEAAIDFLYLSGKINREHMTLLLDLVCKCNLANNLRNSGLTSIL